MKLLVILFLFLIFILFIPIKLKTKLVFNLFKNNGFVSVYFFSFKIMLRRWHFEPRKIVLEDYYEKKKDILIWFKKNEKEKNIFSDIFFDELLLKIKIKSLKFYSNFGFKNNIISTVYFTGLLKIFTGVLKSLILNIKKVKNMEVMLFPNFLKNNSMLCFSLVIQINLFIILSCLTVGILKVIKRGVKNGN